MKYYVYVLRSQNSKKRYIGFTRKDPEIRLKEHNTGKNKWTRINGPFILVYVEEYVSRKEAVNREKYFKSYAGRNYLRKLGY